MRPSTDAGTTKRTTQSPGRRKLAGGPPQSMASRKVGIMKAADKAGALDRRNAIASSRNKGQRGALMSGRAASRGGSANLRARAPIGNPGSRGKAPTTSGYRPNLKMPDVRLPDVGRAAGDFIRETNPIDRLFGEIGRNIKRATGQK